MNAIEIKNVSKSYPGFDLSHISFDLPSGMIVGLIGENGAGKTTLIKMILGMTRKDSGSIEVLGHSDLHADPAAREDIGVVMDDVKLPPAMNATEIGKMLSLIYHHWDQTAYEDFLSLLRVPKNKKFKDLSRGNKMKLGIACALSHQPKLLILDEATSGLDPVVRDQILDLLLDFTRDENHSILMSSHIVSDHEKACDYIAFLHEGQLLLFDQKDSLLEMYGKIACTKKQFAQIDPSAVVGKRETAFGIECIVKKDLVPHDMNIQPVDLEELFVMMVKGENQ